MRCSVVGLLLVTSCSLFAPAVSEGEGEGDLVGEGEGDLVVGEGEGDLVVGEGEGDIVVGEGEGEGEAVVSGCADGSDEGFADLPGLRACRGTWVRAGLQHDRSLTGSAAQLCAVGWHICESAAEVADELGAAACTPEAPGIFVTRQSTSGNNNCSTNSGFGGNDVLGCTNAPTPTNCPPLNTVLAGACAVGGFGCVTQRAGHDEALVITHTAGDGGVLCCIDENLDGSCAAEDLLTVDVDADARLVESSPELSLGRQPFLNANAGFASLVRFSSAALYDPALTQVELVLHDDTSNGNPSARPATLDVRRFLDGWTEFRAGCEGDFASALCDAQGDGVSRIGPDPSLAPSFDTQVRWTGGVFPTGTPIGTFSTSEPAPRLSFSLAPSVVQEGAAFETDLRAGVITFLLENATGSTFFGSKEKGTSDAPSLLLHRCVNR